ncbi:MAG: DUF2339 domain-containing protein, partial [Luteolibacter sp.]
MEAIVFLIALFVVWLLIKVSALRKESTEAREQMQRMLGRLTEMQRELQGIKRGAVVPVEKTKDDAESLRAVIEEHRNEMLADAVVPPPLPEVPIREVIEEREAGPQITDDVDVPAIPVMESAPPLQGPRTPKEEFSLEKFMGVKLFAWLGGVAMFFGVIFFVKYAFEKNLIPPAVRIAMGFVTGTGLLV